MAAASGGLIKAVFFDFGGTLFSYKAIQGARSSRPLYVQAAERTGRADAVR